jgi:hypothetical protein
MSREILHDFVNIDDVIKRFKEFTGLDSKKKIAVLFGIQQNNFSNQKKTGGLIPYFVKHGIQLNVNLNWLFTGKGEREVGQNIIDLLKLNMDVNSINKRMDELQKNAIGHGKIRSGDPIEKKDELISKRSGVIHVWFDRKNNGSKNG